ncbi:AraC family transcriptional regulator ligand-binding domain-containing protein [Fulvivirgaceae bacterium PWU4]|uniref:AraC family transcriptional regulator ligand-binding domain-containing protein n=1 Tax=Chryseosolibacter histidini TaxID=2782349 RepID=A0AAP2GIT1_9BACT|nr:AraC family transcriptional regulator [Chryseosolibacter histidini]MBT1697596.1 AraC family transcriptional regulator ligand-binding domain-containing protein [Chryseosolibacter histidini]
MHFQASILRNHIYSAANHGANFHELCRRINISPEQLNNAEAMIPSEIGGEFWAHAVEMTGDEFLGLHMGSESNNTEFGMLGFLAKSCRTLGDAITTVCRYNDTISGEFIYSLVVTGNRAVLTIEAVPFYAAQFPVAAQQAVEYAMAGFTRAFHSLSGKSANPEHVELRYPKRDIKEYERILRSSVTFQAQRNGIILDKSVLEIPVISYDASLFALFNSLLEQKQQALRSQATLSEKVKRMLLVNFKGQVPHVDILASEMCMTARTLQRKLLEEKTSYRAICNEVRKEVATGLLGQAASRKEDIAALLGYADVRTFQRALSSWSR